MNRLEVELTMCSPSPRPWSPSAPPEAGKPLPQTGGEGKGEGASAYKYNEATLNIRGFTLLEVLVSMAILVIIMAAIYSAYTTNVEAIQIARQNGEVHQTARIVLERVTKDLQSALIQVSVPSEKIRLGLVGEDREIDGKRADRIDFTTVAHLALNEKGPASDLCEIGYMIEEDPEAKVLVLFRRDDPIVDEDFTKGGSLLEMARNVMEFNITYLDSRGEESDKWNTLEGLPGSGLPVLIKVRLVLKDELNREHVFSTTVHPELAERVREK